MRQASMEDAPPIEDEDEEPTSEHVDGLELIFGRGRSGYKDVYPHRKGWQAKVFVEDKGVYAAWEFSRTKSRLRLLWRGQRLQGYTSFQAQIRHAPSPAAEVRKNPALCLPIPFTSSHKHCCSTHAAQ